MDSLYLSCSACFNLDYDQFLDFDWESLSRYRMVSLDDMRAAASTGCKICSIVLEGLNSLWEDKHTSRFPEDSVLLQKHPDRPLSACKISEEYWEGNEETAISDVESWIEFFTHKGRADTVSYIIRQALKLNRRNSFPSSILKDQSGSQVIVGRRGGIDTENMAEILRYCPSLVSGDFHTATHTHS